MHIPTLEGEGHEQDWWVPSQASRPPQGKLPLAGTENDDEGNGDDDNDDDDDDNGDDASCLRTCTLSQELEFDDAMTMMIKIYYYIITY